MMSSRQIIHSAEEISRIRVACRLTDQVRQQLSEMIKPGMTTFDVDMLAGELIQKCGGKSAFKGYYGYPGNICISVNDEVVHGIGRPDRILDPKDIVSIDIGVHYDGAIGDCATTVSFTEQPPEIARLLQGTAEALQLGIQAARAGNYIRNISAAVEGCAKRYKLGIVREYVGHGCGIQLHEPPEIPNFTGPGRGSLLSPGMVLAIEPMLNAGSGAVTTDKLDHWTVRTKDGRWSAHFENMILITDNEPEILTCQKMM